MAPRPTTATSNGVVTGNGGRGRDGDGTGELARGETLRHHVDVADHRAVDRAIVAVHAGRVELPRLRLVGRPHVDAVRRAGDLLEDDGMGGRAEDELHRSPG